MAEERLPLCTNDPTQLCPVNCRLHRDNQRAWKAFNLGVNIILGMSGRQGFKLDELLETMQSLVEQDGHIEGLNLEIEVDETSPNPLCIRN